MENVQDAAEAQGALSGLPQHCYGKSDYAFRQNAILIFQRVTSPGTHAAQRSYQTTPHIIESPLLYPGFHASLLNAIMAPAGRPREPSIERTTDYEAFMASLSAYHKARGYVGDFTHNAPRVDFSEQSDVNSRKSPGQI